MKETKRADGGGKVKGRGHTGTPAGPVGLCACSVRGPGGRVLSGTRTALGSDTVCVVLPLKQQVHLKNKAQPRPWTGSALRTWNRASLARWAAGGGRAPRRGAIRPCLEVCVSPTSEMGHISGLKCHVRRSQDRGFRVPQASVNSVTVVGSSPGPQETQFLPQPGEGVTANVSIDLTLC